MSVRTYELRENKRRNSDVKLRIEALRGALDSGRGWLTPDTVAETEKQLSVARGRLRQSLDHTVVAIAGPTGAGKSSLINVLSERDLARVSVRRPTTSQALAVVWDSSEAGRMQAARLLDWLGVSERHYLSAQQPDPIAPVAKKSIFTRPAFGRGRSGHSALTPDTHALGQVASSSTLSGVNNQVGSMPTAVPVESEGATGILAAREDTVAPTSVNPSLPTKEKKLKGALHTGLIVVDLPDFDSVVTEHRVRADHLTERSDLLVWVTDPQKYADAIFHQEYLQRFAQHTEMLVVLNQVDRLTAAQKEQCLTDIKRLLAEDGITGATVIPASTKTGEGISALQSLLENAATRKAAQSNAIIAELRQCGKKIAAECGQVPSRNVSDVPKEELVESLVQASGVYGITEAVYQSARRRSKIATGWPVTSWITKLQKDPLRTLGLSQKWLPRISNGPTPAPPEEEIHPATARSSVMSGDSGLAAKSNIAVREYVDAATAGGPVPWVLGVRKKLADIDLADDLDSAITNSPAVHLTKPSWWRVVGLLHKLFLLAFAVGFVWLGVLAGAAYLRLEVANTPSWMGFPIPTLLAVGGLLAGIILGMVCRLASMIHARRQSKTVYETLRSEVQGVAFNRVVLPVREARDVREACVLAALVAAR